MTEAASPDVAVQHMSDYEREIEWQLCCNATSFSQTDLTGFVRMAKPYGRIRRTAEMKRAIRISERPGAEDEIHSWRRNMPFPKISLQSRTKN